MVFLTSSFGALDGKARALGTTRSVPLSPSSREGSSTHSLIGTGYGCEANVRRV